MERDREGRRDERERVDLHSRVPSAGDAGTDARICFAQAYRDYEVIITDDSPDDAVERVVRRYGDARVRYYRNAERKGSPENWNEAVRRATGRYIKMMHHDDWFLSGESLGSFVEALEKDGASLAFSAAHVCDEAGKVVRIEGATAEEVAGLRRDPKALFPGNFIGVPSATIYRNRGGQEYDRRMRWLVDMEFYIRYLRHEPGVAYVERALVGRTSGSAEQVTAECEHLREVELPEWIYFYKVLGLGWRPSRAQRRFMWALFRKHDVKSAAELVEAGAERPIPGFLRAMVVVQRGGLAGKRMLRRLGVLRDGEAERRTGPRRHGDTEH